MNGSDIKTGRKYELDCFPDYGSEEAPDVAVVILTSKDIERLGQLHEAVMNAGAYRISEFDDTPTFLANGPDADGEDYVRTDICMLNMYSSGEFSWSAVYKHTNLAFSTERMSLIALIEGS